LNSKLYTISSNITRTEKFVHEGPDFEVKSKHYYIDFCTEQLLWFSH